MTNINDLETDMK